MSSSIPYTHGNWKLVKGNIESNGKVLASVYKPNELNIENLCNASIMVASPKMYEALKVIVNKKLSYLPDDVFAIISEALNTAEEVKQNAVLRLDER